MERTLADFGIDYFTFQDLPNPNRYADFVFAKRVPEDWLRLYVERQFNSIDPAFKMSRRTTEPFIWAHAPYDAEREPHTAAFVRLVEDFGLARGLMIPVPRITRRSGVVWFGGPNAELDHRTIPVLHFIALYAFERLRQHCAPAYEEKAVLTAREREVLAWTASGKTAWEIGEILNISKRTVEAHTNHAVRKLHTTNRTHAVAVAVRDRLIEI